MKKQSPMRKVWQLAASQHGKLKRSIVLALLGVIGGIVPYYAAGKILTHLLQGDREFIFYLTYCLLGLLGYLLKTGLYTLALAVSHEATFEVLKEVREKLLQQLPKLSLGQVTQRPSGAWKQIIVDQVESLERPIAHIIPEMTANLFGPLCILLYLFVLDWRMALLSLVSFPIGMFFMSFILKDYERKYQGSVKVGAAMNATIAEYAGGIEVIKAYNQGDLSYDKFSDKILANAAYYYDWMASVQFLMSLSKAILPTTLLAVLPAGWLFYQNQSLTGGDFLMIVILAFSLSGFLTAAMNFVDSLARVGTVIAQVEAVLNAKEQQQGKTPVTFENYAIEVQNLSFSYGEGKTSNDVLHGVSFRLPEQSFNAFVGPSGGGKSTLAKLIAGFYEVERGSIKIGGHEIKNIPLDQLYDSIAYVSQDTFLFDTSVRENIRMGRLTATDAEVEAIAKASGCHNFIVELEQGYDTVAGRGGAHLSGGERQRIALARAMLKDAPIVIFDEATAYLDPENEAVLQQAIEKLVQGKTVLAIAHRLSTIQGADQILVINEGKVASCGTHAELLATSRLYQAMWQAHLGAKKGAFHV